MARSITLKETKTLRAVLYTRVIAHASTGNTLDDLRELRLQAGECKAAKIHATVVGWYDDDQPDSEYRKGIARLQERLVNDRDVDVVIVDRPNTLATDRAGRAELRAWIRHGGAKLVKFSSTAARDL
jgi:hypothetical protein